MDVGRIPASLGAYRLFVGAHRRTGVPLTYFSGWRKEGRQDAEALSMPCLDKVKSFAFPFRTRNASEATHPPPPPGGYFSWVLAFMAADKRNDAKDFFLVYGSSFFTNVAEKTSLILF